ncbi:hypothetical protein AB8P51_12545 [Muriicola sp. SD30]|uniref:hypothetical protein n=1 Tax=Muriicola sp. SD30 TaxID=3240936 RepID=UPI00350EBD78
MRKFLVLVLFSLSFSCIPIKIAPKIDDYKIVVAKKFKRDLPRQHAFVFEDDKEADEFYHYINTRFDLEYENVELNVPFTVSGQTYFMSFDEREKVTEVVNLLPIVIAGVLKSEAIDPILEDASSSRNSNWYVLITVMDGNFNDCLAPEYPFREEVILFLHALKKEYQSTHHYVEALLKK